MDWLKSWELKKERISRLAPRNPPQGVIFCEYKVRVFFEKRVEKIGKRQRKVYFCRVKRVKDFFRKT